MQPQVVAQLGVKPEGEDAVVANRDRTTLMRGNHLDVAGALDQRCSDEHTGKGLAVQAVDLNGSLEAVHLPAVAVAADSDVEQTKPMLLRHPVCDFLGEHDHARARGEPREAAANCLPEGPQPAS